MKKLSATFHGIRFQFSLDDEFADYVHKDLCLNAVEFDRDNELRKLLNAYLKKSDEVFRLEKKLDRILQKLESIEEK